MTFKHSRSNRVILLYALKRRTGFLNLLDVDMLVTFLFSLAHYEMLRAA